MKQLTEQELSSKIQSFLRERMNAHPELENIESSSGYQSLSDRVVSRVKNISKKFHTAPVNSRTVTQL